VFSCSKGITASTLNLILMREEVSLGTKVCDVWPEFITNMRKPDDMSLEEFETRKEYKKLLSSLRRLESPVNIRYRFRNQRVGQYTAIIKYPS
jgi:hypothetical protein